MHSGLNQDVEILGRTFHLQTQVTSGDEPTIRTEVFLGGKLVATRERALEPDEAELGEDGLRALIKEHHQKIHSSVVARARRYQQRRPASPASEVAPAAEAPAEDGGDAPQAARGSSLELGLRVRRLFEKFRLRLRAIPGESGGDFHLRLEKTAGAFAAVLSSPVFPRIRVDEQVRFNLLKEQLEEWLRGGHDPARGEALWAEVQAFNEYLAGVNDRAELAAFDRDLIRWALRKIASEGVSEGLLRHLSMLAGRDVELDALLKRPQAVDPEAWTAHLRRVLARLEATAGA